MKNSDFELAFVVVATLGTLLAGLWLTNDYARHADKLRLQVYKANMECRVRIGAFEADRVCGSVPTRDR